jgi:long-subunit fatty acid transport protein
MDLYPLERPRRAGTALVTHLGVVGLLAACAMVTTSVFASDGMEPIAISPQALARGGADVAVGDSALSQIDNPASLALRPRDVYSFDTFGELGIVRNAWDSPIDSSVSERKLAPLMNLGFAMPLNDRLTVGAALHSKAGFGSAYRSRHLLIPFMHRRAASDLKVFELPVNAAYKVTDKLSLGLGVRAEIATAKFNTVLGPADVEFGRGYAYGGGFQLGAHYQARDDLAFGLAYRSPTWSSDLSGGRASASVLGLLPVPLGGASIPDLQLPQRMIAGAAWDATSWMKLVSEVRWLDYTHSTLHSTAIHTDGVLDLHYPFPLGYHDQWAFIQGAEFKLREHWKLGIGYHYATPAVSASNLLPVASVIVQHHATIGLRYETDSWWAGGGYLIGFTSSLHGPGYSKIPLGIDYGSSSLHQAQHAIAFGFGYRW